MQCNWPLAYKQRRIVIMTNRFYGMHTKIDIVLVATSTVLFVGTLPLLGHGLNVKYAFLIASNIFEFVAIIAAILSLISIGNYGLNPNGDTGVRITKAAGMSFFSLFTAGVCVNIFEMLNVFGN
jgi:hypothetical protein